MENVVARFEKVSFDEYLKHFNAPTEEEYEAIKEEYDAIQLPVRATTGSAGYDFCIPYAQYVRAGQTYVVPTGIRVSIEPGWFLNLVPRSGLGFKYGMKLENTCGIIDSDYYYADNEGHIMAKISARTAFELDRGDRFMQGILLPHGLTSDDAPLKETRHGGFGSTGA